MKAPLPLRPTPHALRSMLRALGCLLPLAALWWAPAPVQAQSGQVIPLTLDAAVEMATDNSYRVRQLQLGIARTRSWLRAERAGLKSRVYMEVTSPEIEAISDNKWNSDLHRYEIVRENSRLWQMNLAVRQPVILFGYPTNGYLSLNNRMYRYTQLNGGRDVKYYNRYFIKYEQPLFQPNHLKNDLEEAELDLDNEELEFQENIVRLVDDIADDYYRLFELAYEEVIYQNVVANLERALPAVQGIVQRDTSRAIEASQLRVELANARERVKQIQSRFRLQAAEMKQRLRLEEQDSLVIVPSLQITPVEVDVAQAVRYGYTLRPQLRQLEIRRRNDEINLQNARGWDSFRANLEVTYGRETQDPRFQRLWEEPTDSYSVGLRAYIPIWDWGRRSARIQAQKIGLQRTDLYIEETQKEIQSDITLAVRNLSEYQQRALTMQENLEMAREISEASLSRYRNGTIAILDLLQSFNRQTETARNFLDAYMGYRQAVLSLQQLTFYDFERNVPLLERFRVGTLQPSL